MNGKKAKALRKLARKLARERSELMVQLHERATLIERDDGTTKAVPYTAVTAHYPNLCARSLYQRLKNTVNRRPSGHS